MSRVYTLSDHTDAVKAKLEKKEIPGLELVHKPKDNDGKDNFWPYGVTDGKSYGWFENGMILFWGANNETPILDALQGAGFNVTGEF